MIKKSVNISLLITSLVFFSCLTDNEIKTEPVPSPIEENKTITQNKLLFNELDGQYVYFHDTRKDMGNRLTGFLYLGKNKFLARTYEMSSKKEVKIYLEIKLINDKYEINILKNDYVLDNFENQALNEDSFEHFKRYKCY